MDQKIKALMRFLDASHSVYHATAGLVEELDLDGVGIWTAMKYFPQLWLVLNATYPIRKVLA